MIRFHKDYVGKIKKIPLIMARRLPGDAEIVYASTDKAAQELNLTIVGFARLPRTQVNKQMQRNKRMQVVESHLPLGLFEFWLMGCWHVLLLAAGAALSAVEYVVDGHGKIAYALVRPPGHHAQPSRADGYCFLNNAGLAVQLALDSGCKRVAVIDLDVHYGNGTAEGFYRTNRVLTISLHMNHGSWGPSHPQAGTIDELGDGAGLGYNLNIPLPNGTGDRGYGYAMSELVVPAVDNFNPDLIVMVIGEDSSAFDPNGRQCLTVEGYRKLGNMIQNLAKKHTSGRLLIVQEGGYHVTYAAYCLHGALEGVLDLPLPLLWDPISYYPEDESLCCKVVDLIKEHWKLNVPFLTEKL